MRHFISLLQEYLLLSNVAFSVFFIYCLLLSSYCLILFYLSWDGHRSHLFSNFSLYLVISAGKKLLSGIVCSDFFLNASVVIFSF